MKLTFAIVFTILPTAFHFFFDLYRVKVLKKPVRHGISAALTLLVCLLGYFNPTAPYWWQTPVLALSFHYLVFDLFFNLKALNRTIDYFGDNLWDRFHEWLASKISWIGLYAFKLMIFLSALTYYITGCIHWNCLPF